MASTKRLLIVVSGLIMVVTGILYIVSNALPLWGKGNNLDVSQIGLWKWRRTVEERLVCGNLVCLSSSLVASDSQCAKMLTAETFVTIACIMSVLSVIFLFARLLQSADSNRIVVLTSKSLPFITLIAGIIGVAVGIAFVTYKDALKINAAAILGIVAVVINLIGAILAAMIR